MSHFLRGTLAAGLIAAFTLPAFAEGDAAKGEKVFKKCLACHAIKEGAPNKVGPNLRDVIGRKTGSVEGFAYSDVMKKMGEEGHIWTGEEVDKFVENPKAFANGTKMAFAGLKKPEERADLVAYLTSLNPDGAASAAPAADAAAPADGAEATTEAPAEAAN